MCAVSQIHELLEWAARRYGAELPQAAGSVAADK